MREFRITVQPTTGGFHIAATVYECAVKSADDVVVNSNLAVASTWSQIPSRVKSLIDAAAVHMQPKEQ